MGTGRVDRIYAGSRLRIGKQKWFQELQVNRYNVIDSLTKKIWSDSDEQGMLGHTLSTHLAYALDKKVRREAASGGATSALLIHALERKFIDGAIVCKSFIDNGRVRARFEIARSREEILSAQGSKYVETKFLKEVLPLLRDNHGKYAVCGLPCDISNLKRWEEKEPELESKVALRVSFLCGHNSRKELIDGITRKLQKEQGAEKNLTVFKFRTGHWRGDLEARYDDDTTVKKRFSYFSDYRNLSFFCEKKCTACIDHFGFQADISFGDVWLYSLKNNPLKHGCVVIRSSRGQKLFNQAIECNALESTQVERRLILDGQSRIAPTHYDITARSKAAKLLGANIPDKLKLKTSTIKVLSSFIGLFNMKISEGKFSNFIFLAPRPMIRGYLYIKKGLETLA